jgi:hypothetical protein
MRVFCLSLRAAEIDAGLVRDDESTYTDRLMLWNEFNNCWLSMLQRQREMTEATLETGQRPHPPHTMLEVDQMENLGKELVRLCDMMEKHGLVDYQMGVWEEEIITRKEPTQFFFFFWRRRRRLWIFPS